MILNVFNVIRFIESQTGGFDDSIYIIDYGINYVILSINSVFNWETLANELKKAFKQAQFKFNIIGLDLKITW